MALSWIWTIKQMDAGRIKRARGLILEGITVDEGSGKCTAECAGEKGDDAYHFTLTSCICRDFRFNLHGQSPCKHIISLGMELGLINQDGMTEKEVRKKAYVQKRAEVEHAFAEYYLFQNPIISDREYDQLKQDFVNEFKDEGFEMPVSSAK